MRDSSGDDLLHSLTQSGIPGKRFGPYLIQSVIARGGMGVVYMAYHQGLQRQVALKTLSDAVSASPEEVQRFVTEARLVAKINHANVVPVYDAGEINGVRYLAMEFVPGKTIGELIVETGALSPDHAIALVRDVGLGLRCAHALGILHRDLKPANVLVQADGVPRLTDFGVARQAGAERMTATGVVLGTPNYMPPEQAKGEQDVVDVRSDVYGLGTILYECVTGLPPFRRGSQLATLQAVVSDPLESPRSLRPELSADLEAVCIKAMAKSLEDRYDDVEAFVEDLDRLLAGARVRARLASPARRVARTVRRNGVLVVAAAIALVAALALGAAAIRFRRSGGDLESRSAAWKAQRLDAVRAELSSMSRARLQETLDALSRQALERAALDALALGAAPRTSDRVRRGLGDAEAYAQDVGPLLASIHERLASFASQDSERMQHLERARLLDPEGRAGRASRLTLARALYARPGASSRRLALDELAALAAQADSPGLSARALQVQRYADSFDWGEAAATADLLEGAAPPSEDAEGARRLGSLARALVPTVGLNEVRSLTIARDAEGPLLVRTRGRVVSTYRLGQSKGDQGLTPLHRWDLEGWSPRALEAVTWGDGDAQSLAVVVQSRGAVRIGVLNLDAQGNFPEVREVLEREVAGSLTQVAAGDVNGDGRTDLAFCVYGRESECFVFLGGEGQRVVSLLSGRPPSPYAFATVALSDLDGDGRDEVLLGASKLMRGGVTSLALAHDGGAFEDRGSVVVGVVRRLFPLPEGGGVLAVVDREEESDRLARAGAPEWLGRDGIYVLGYAGERLALKARWTFGRDAQQTSVEALRTRSVDGFAMRLGGAVWVARSHWEEGELPWLLELIPLADLTDPESNPEPVLRVRHQERSPQDQQLQARLVGDVDGDGDDDLALGGWLFGAGRRSKEPLSLDRASAQATARPARLLGAYRQLAALGYAELGDRFLAELRARYPDSRSAHEAAVDQADGLIDLAEEARTESLRAFDRGDSERGRALQELARTRFTRAAEFSEEQAESAAPWRLGAGAAWGKAGYAWQRAGRADRSFAAYTRAVASEDLGADEVARLRQAQRAAQRLSQADRVTVSFGAMAEPQAGLLRPLRARLGETSARIPVSPEVTDYALVPVSLSPQPLVLEAELQVHGNAWCGRLQVGLFETQSDGAPSYLTGFELSLWNVSSLKLELRALVRGLPATPKVRLPEYAARLKLRLECTPLAGGETLCRLEVRDGEGDLLCAVEREAAVTLPAGRGREPISCAVGVVSPAATNIEDVRHEQRFWRLDSRVTLTRISLASPGVALGAPTRLLKAGAALARGRDAEARGLYDAIVAAPESEAERLTALWYRGFARARLGHDGARDLVASASGDPFEATLRFEDLARSLFDSPTDLATAGAALRALASSKQRVLQVLSRQLAGEFSAFADPSLAETDSERRALIYLSMRRVTKPRQRWAWAKEFKALAPGRRLPRSLLPPLLCVPAAPMDDTTYRQDVARADVSFYQAYALASRAWCARPAAVLAPTRIAQLYRLRGRAGAAAQILEQALATSARAGDTRDSAPALYTYALCLSDLGDREGLLGALEALVKAGADKASLRAFEPFLRGDPRYERLLEGD